MITRGGGNFSVMAASPRAFRVGPSESAETGGPCRAQERPGAAQEPGAGFNAREVPKVPRVRRQLFRYSCHPAPSAHTRAALPPTQTGEPPFCVLRGRGPFYQLTPQV